MTDKAFRVKLVIVILLEHNSTKQISLLILALLISGVQSNL